MLHKKYTIAMVNYLNAKPFLFGFKNVEGVSEIFDISLLNPAECAHAFQQNKVDIALVPVGSLLSLQNYKRITSYGIAADDEVRTVCLFSNQPPDQWKEVFLDDHSMTSVILAKLIIRDVLHICPSFVTKKVENHNLQDGQAILMIGDKVFQYENNFEVKLDLAAWWKNWTDLPFVFAVWIAKTEISDEIIQKLNPVFEYGLAHIDEIISQSPENPELLSLYYKKYIRYFLDKDYEKGLETYLVKAATI